jgi:hypothetical protein
MASLRQSTLLSNVSIPGTHESCALYDHAKAGYNQCQWLTIPEQLLNGIRFLDIRPRGDTLEITHAGADQKITFGEVQQQVVDFLKDNPSEIVLMNVQQEYVYVPNAEFVKKFNEAVAGYVNYWFFEARIPTIEEARGRIVLIRGYNPTGFNPTAPTNGSWLADKGIPLNALTIEGTSANEYFRFQNDSKAWESDNIRAIETMIDEGIIDNRIVLNFLSYAHFGATPGRNAAAMNPLIYEYIKERTNSKLGILPMDFATNTPGFIEEIIRHNLKWGEVVSADFSGSGHKDNAVFIDKGNNTTALLLFSAFQLIQVWISEPGHWQATQMSKAVAGDFSGTGKMEIAVFYDYGHSQTKLWLFSATGDGYFQPRQVWDSGAGHWDASGMSRILVGDFSGSGQTEIAVFYNYGNYQTKLWLFSVGSGQPFEPKIGWDSGAGHWDANGMSRVAVGDFSGTGKSEIAVFYNYGHSQTKLWLFSATADGSFQPRQVWDSGADNWEVSGMSEIITGDFSGSGQTEIAVFYNYGHSQTKLWLFSAASSQPFEPKIVWDSGAGYWGYIRMSGAVAGDFSGTGKMEIATFYDYYGGRIGLWLFSATSSNSFQHKQVWDSGPGYLRVTGMSEIVAGDFSRSGQTEIAAFYDYDPFNTGVWLFSDDGNNSFQRQSVWEGKLF